MAAGWSGGAPAGFPRSIATGSAAYGVLIDELVLSGPPGSPSPEPETAE